MPPILERGTKTVLLAAVLALAGCGAESVPPTPSDPPAEDLVAVDPVSFPCGDWQPQDSGTEASFRGLSAVGSGVVWVSGTGGTFGRTLDGGESWRMATVPGAVKLDFRDVDAFDESTAYLMSAGPGELSQIWKTTAGGVTWSLQFTNPWPEGFLDGMAFWDAERGLAYGDPVAGRFFILATADGGATW